MSDGPQSLIPALPPAPEPTAPAPSKRKALIAGATVGVLILVTGITIYAFLQGGNAEAQPLALSFTQGQSQTYEIHQTMDGRVVSGLMGEQALQMDVKQGLTWEVTSVDEDGVATILVTASEMSGTVNGIPIPTPPQGTPPIEMVIAPDGRIVSAGGLALGGAGQTQGFGFPGMGQLTPLLPDEGETVAVGDSWEKSFSQEFPFGEGTIEFTATSTYERDETVNGRAAAVIVTEMTVPMEFTLSFADLLEALGPEAAGATGADLPLFDDAQIASEGEGTITQTSFVDLEAKELLETESSGTFGIVMSFTGIPGLEVAGPAEVAFDGAFTQEMALR